MNAVLARLKRIRAAAGELRAASTAQKNRALLRAAELLGEQQEMVLAANRRDLKEWDRANTQKGKSEFRDRLLLDGPRVDQMITGLRQIAKLPDPVGEVVEHRTLANGLKIRKVRAPLGVIFMIFESRPNVAIDAFALAIKSGNAVLLKGGRESRHTVASLYRILEEACTEANFKQSVFWGFEDPNRKITEFLLTCAEWIDVVVPRGGAKLIEYVIQNSKIPIIKNDRGLCHVYVHRDANLEMAAEIVLNAKTQRAGVCNAMETVLVHRDTASRFVPEFGRRLAPYNVEWHACPTSYKLLSAESRNVKKAKKQDWDTEYLDLILNCQVVESLEAALEHIAQHGSKHSESIITASAKTAKKFQTQVDAAVVYWNASTRFTDGFALGLGAELGISTQKLHVRGPVGLRELTSVRWMIDGQGQIRR